MGQSATGHVGADLIRAGVHPAHSGGHAQMSAKRPSSARASGHASAGWTRRAPTTAPAQPIGPAEQVGRAWYGCVPVRTNPPLWCLCSGRPSPGGNSNYCRAFILKASVAQQGDGGAGAASAHGGKKRRRGGSYPRKGREVEWDIPRAFSTGTTPHKVRTFVTFVTGGRRCCLAEIH